MASGYIDLFRKLWGWLSVDSGEPEEDSVVAEAAALDWTLPTRRLHCELTRTRIEATMLYGRLAFETPGERVAYTLPHRRLDYSLDEVTA